MVLMDRKCGNCGSENMSQGITALIVFNNKLPRGSYPLIPSDEYHICFDCKADVRLIDKACESHPVVRESGKWISAILIFDNRHVLRVDNPVIHVLQA